MRHLAVALLLAAAAAAEPVYFRIDLSPSGSRVSIGEPVARGSMLVFRAYPDGKLMSVRRSDVRGTSRITAKEAAGPATASTTSIGNLAMQGGGASGAPGSSHSSSSAKPGSQGPQVFATRDGLAVTTSAQPPK
jgi:hypothetical protein